MNTLELSLENEDKSLVFDLSEIDLNRINNYLAIRRYFELFIILILLPFFLTGFIVSFIITLFSGIETVFFKQKRNGQNLKEFEIYKFRTMTQSEKGELYSPKLSSFLRKHRLDEIPQIFNILKGDISLIGPRTEPIWYFNDIISKYPEYKFRFVIKPGLTGYAQVYYKHTVTVDDAIEKYYYDLYYLKNISFLLDMKIIFRTIYVMLICNGDN
jgi:lipopolysaccharide/colanic/teichoic acid biosynthesis glycosyltransferase